MRKRFRRVQLHAVVILLVTGGPAFGAAESDYNTAHQQFLTELAYAQTRGIGIRSYQIVLDPVDIEHESEGEREASFEKLASLRAKLKKQLTEIDREGYESLGCEILSKLFRGLKHIQSLDASVEFYVNRDGQFGHFKWLHSCGDKEKDQELLDAFSRISLNKRSPNQAELPLTGRLGEFGYSNLMILDRKTGKWKRGPGIKFPCCRPLPLPY